MAIEKSNVKLSRFDSEFSHGSGETMSNDEGELLQRRILAANVDSEDANGEDDNDDFDDADSGAGSDDFDLLELAETGAEFCQMGDVTCSIPFELYDLSSLEALLSVEVWNECLTEEERFSLAKYLPDMDQLTFMQTLKELFEGSNFHFGSPIKQLFEMLKGGKCEPRSALYLEGRNLFLKTKHYHLLRKYHNDMVVNLCQIRNAWANCKGYSIDEKLRVLNIMKSQKDLMYEKREDFEADSSEKEEPYDGSWRRKVKDKANRRSGFGLGPGFDLSPWRQSTAALVQKDRYGRLNSKPVSKTAGPKFPLMKDTDGLFALAYNGTGMSFDPYSSSSLIRRRKYGSDDDDDDNDDDPLFGMGSGFSRPGKKHVTSRDRDVDSKHFTGLAKQPQTKARKYSENFIQPRGVVEQMKPPLKGSLADLRGELPRHGKNNGDGYSVDLTYVSNDRNGRSKKPKFMRESPDVSSRSYSASLEQMNERFLNTDFGENPMQEKIRVNVVPNGKLGGSLLRNNRMFVRNDDTESDSSEEYNEEEESYKNLKIGKKEMREVDWDVNGRRDYSKDTGKSESKKRSLKAKQKDKFGERMSEQLQKQSNDDDDDDDDSFKIRTLVNDSTLRSRLGKRCQAGEGNNDDNSNNGTRKRKERETVIETAEMVDEFMSSKKKGKKKVEEVVGSAEMEASETHKTEVETKHQKKPFVLITPTIHTSFSFSVIHLLSSVRMAMISSRPEDSLDASRGRGEEAEENGVSTSKGTDGRGDLPSLTVQEIVSCVKSNPGDPCILETQEPLQDLVRGVLKIFASKTSPLGAKGWKPLVAYERASKSWAWAGPLPVTSSDHETVEEVTSPETWGLPHKMLVKLVDSFANWLKNGQETLQQIGSLPEPPLSLMQCNLDEKERFKDLRAQKSLHTITPSSEEARDYFQKEEFLRYSIPDRAFAYTAADGKKSIVAPLRRGGGKPTSKAREHFMLKKDRPPHVTILCLVRDAAARLPGSIGTRADVCTLIKDSQYVVDDVTEVQVNQVVSGALDRLHYERDPCVQFDSDRKLWVYLHRDREEEDFEDDGTSSTKKWKRPKKESSDQPDQGTVTVAYPGNNNEEQPSPAAAAAAVAAAAVDEEEEEEDDRGTEPPLCKDDNNKKETEQVAEEGCGNNSYSTAWDIVASNPIEANTFLCQENSADDDFDDET